MSIFANRITAEEAKSANNFFAPYQSQLEKGARRVMINPGKGEIYGNAFDLALLQASRPDVMSTQALAEQMVVPSAANDNSLNGVMGTNVSGLLNVNLGAERQAVFGNVFQGMFPDVAPEVVNGIASRVYSEENRRREAADLQNWVIPIWSLPGYTAEQGRPGEDVNLGGEWYEKGVEAASYIPFNPVPRLLQRTGADRYFSERGSLYGLGKSIVEDAGLPPTDENIADALASAKYIDPRRAEAARGSKENMANLMEGMKNSRIIGEEDLAYMDITQFPEIGAEADALGLTGRGKATFIYHQAQTKVARELAKAINDPSSVANPTALMMQIEQLSNVVGPDFLDEVLVTVPQRGDWADKAWDSLPESRKFALEMAGFTKDTFLRDDEGNLQPNIRNSYAYQTQAMLAAQEYAATETREAIFEKGWHDGWFNWTRRLSDTVSVDIANDPYAMYFLAPSVVGGVGAGLTVGGALSSGAAATTSLGRVMTMTAVDGMFAGAAEGYVADQFGQNQRFMQGFQSDISYSSTIDTMVLYGGMGAIGGAGIAGVIGGAGPLVKLSTQSLSGLGRVADTIAATGVTGEASMIRALNRIAEREATVAEIEGAQIFSNIENKGVAVRLNRGDVEAKDVLAEVIPGMVRRESEDAPHSTMIDDLFSSRTLAENGMSHATAVNLVYGIQRALGRNGQIGADEFDNIIKAAFRASKKHADEVGTSATAGADSTAARIRFIDEALKADGVKLAENFVGGSRLRSLTDAQHVELKKLMSKLLRRERLTDKQMGKLINYSLSLNDQRAVRNIRKAINELGNLTDEQRGAYNKKVTELLANGDKVRKDPFLQKVLKAERALNLLRNERTIQVLADLGVSAKRVMQYSQRLKSVIGDDDAVRALDAEFKGVREAIEEINAGKGMEVLDGTPPAFNVERFLAESDVTAKLRELKELRKKLRKRANKIAKTSAKKGDSKVEKRLEKLAKKARDKYQALSAELGIRLDQEEAYTELLARLKEDIPFANRTAVEKDAILGAALDKIILRASPDAIEIGAENRNKAWFASMFKDTSIGRRMERLMASVSLWPQTQQRLFRSRNRVVRGFSNWITGQHVSARLYSNSTDFMSIEAIVEGAAREVLPFMNTMKAIRTNLGEKVFRDFDTFFLRQRQLGKLKGGVDDFDLEGASPALLEAYARSGGKEALANDLLAAQRAYTQFMARAIDEADEAGFPMGIDPTRYVPNSIRGNLTKERADKFVADFLKMRRTQLIDGNGTLDLETLHSLGWIRLTTGGEMDARGRRLANKKFEVPEDSPFYISNDMDVNIDFAKKVINGRYSGLMELDSAVSARTGSASGSFGEFRPGYLIGDDDASVDAFAMQLRQAFEIAGNDPAMPLGRSADAATGDQGAARAIAGLDEELTILESAMNTLSSLTAGARALYEEASGETVDAAANRLATAIIKRRKMLTALVESQMGDVAPNVRRTKMTAQQITNLVQDEAAYRALSPGHDALVTRLKGLIAEGIMDEENARIVMAAFADIDPKKMAAMSIVRADAYSEVDGFAYRATQGTGPREEGDSVGVIELRRQGDYTNDEQQTAVVLMHEVTHLAFLSAPPRVQATLQALYSSVKNGQNSEILRLFKEFGIDVNYAMSDVHEFTAHLAEIAVMRDRLRVRTPETRSFFKQFRKYVRQLVNKVFLIDDAAPTPTAMRSILGEEKAAGIRKAMKSILDDVEADEAADNLQRLFDIGEDSNIDVFGAANAEALAAALGRAAEDSRVGSASARGRTPAQLQQQIMMNNINIQRIRDTHLSADDADFLDLMADKAPDLLTEAQIKRMVKLQNSLPEKEQRAIQQLADENSRLQESVDNLLAVAEHNASVKNSIDKQAKQVKHMENEIVTESKLLENMRNAAKRGNVSQAEVENQTRRVASMKDQLREDKSKLRALKGESEDPISVAPSTTKKTEDAIEAVERKLDAERAEIKSYTFSVRYTDKDGVSRKSNVMSDARSQDEALDEWKANNPNAKVDEVKFRGSEETTASKAAEPETRDVTSLLPKSKAKRFTQADATKIHRVIKDETDLEDTAYSFEVFGVMNRETGEFPETAAGRTKDFAGRDLQEGDILKVSSYARPEVRGDMGELLDDHFLYWDGTNWRLMDGVEMDEIDAFYQGPRLADKDIPTIRQKPRSAMAIYSEMTELEARLAKLPADSDEFAEIAARYGTLRGEFDKIKFKPHMSAPKTDEELRGLMQATTTREVRDVDNAATERVVEEKVAKKAEESKKSPAPKNDEQAQEMLTDLQDRIIARYINEFHKGNMSSNAASDAIQAITDILYGPTMTRGLIVGEDGFFWPKSADGKFLSEDDIYSLVTNRQTVDDRAAKNAKAKAEGKRLDTENSNVRAMEKKIAREQSRTEGQRVTRKRFKIAKARMKELEELEAKGKLTPDEEIELNEMRSSAKLSGEAAEGAMADTAAKASDAPDETMNDLHSLIEVGLSSGDKAAKKAAKDLQDAEKLAQAFERRGLRTSGKGGFKLTEEQIAEIAEETGLSKAKVKGHNYNAREGKGAETGGLLSPSAGNARREIIKEATSETNRVRAKASLEAEQAAITARVQEEATAADPIVQDMVAETSTGQKAATSVEKAAEKGDVPGLPGYTKFTRAQLYQMIDEISDPFAFVRAAQQAELGEGAAYGRQLGELWYKRRLETGAYVPGEKPIPSSSELTQMIDDVVDDLAEDISLPITAPRQQQELVQVTVSAETRLSDLSDAELEEVLDEVAPREPLRPSDKELRQRYSDLDPETEARAGRILDPDTEEEAFAKMAGVEDEDPIMQQQRRDLLTFMIRRGDDVRYAELKEYEMSLRRMTPEELLEEYRYYKARDEGPKLDKLSDAELKARWDNDAKKRVNQEQQGLGPGQDEATFTNIGEDMPGRRDVSEGQQKLKDQLNELAQTDPEAAANIVLRMMGKEPDEAGDLFDPERFLREKAERKPEVAVAPERVDQIKSRFTDEFNPLTATSRAKSLTDAELDAVNRNPEGLEWPHVVAIQKEISDRAAGRSAEPPRVPAEDVAAFEKVEAAAEKAIRAVDEQEDKLKAAKAAHRKEPNSTTRAALKAAGEDLAKAKQEADRAQDLLRQELNKYGGNAPRAAESTEAAAEAAVEAEGAAAIAARDPEDEIMEMLEDSTYPGGMDALERDTAAAAGGGEEGSGLLDLRPSSERIAEAEETLEADIAASKARQDETLDRLEKEADELRASRKGASPEELTKIRRRLDAINSEMSNVQRSHKAKVKSLKEDHKKFVDRVSEPTAAGGGEGTPPPKPKAPAGADDDLPRRKRKIKEARERKEAERLDAEAEAEAKSVEKGSKSKKLSPKERARRRETSLNIRRARSMSDDALIDEMIKLEAKIASGEADRFDRRLMRRYKKEFEHRATREERVLPDLEGAIKRRSSSNVGEEGFNEAHRLAGSGKGLADIYRDAVNGDVSILNPAYLREQAEAGLSEVSALERVGRNYLEHAGGRFKTSFDSSIQDINQHINVVSSINNLHSRTFSDFDLDTEGGEGIAELFAEGSNSMEGLMRYADTTLGTIRIQKAIDSLTGEKGVTMTELFDQVEKALKANLMREDTGRVRTLTSEAVNREVAEYMQQLKEVYLRSRGINPRKDQSFSQASRIAQNLAYSILGAKFAMSVLFVETPMAVLRTSGLNPLKMIQNTGTILGGYLRAANNAAVQYKPLQKFMSAMGMDAQMMRESVDDMSYALQNLRSNSMSRFGAGSEAMEDSGLLFTLGDRLRTHLANIRGAAAGEGVSDPNMLRRMLDMLEAGTAMSADLTGVMSFMHPVTNAVREVAVNQGKATLMKHSLKLQKLAQMIDDAGEVTTDQIIGMAREVGVPRQLAVYAAESGLLRHRGQLIDMIMFMGEVRPGSAGRELDMNLMATRIEQQRQRWLTTANGTNFDTAGQAQARLYNEVMPSLNQYLMYVTNELSPEMRGTMRFQGMNPLTDLLFQMLSYPMAAYQSLVSNGVTARGPLMTAGILTTLVGLEYYNRNAQRAMLGKDEEDRQKAMEKLTRIPTQEDVIEMLAVYGTSSPMFGAVGNYVRDLVGNPILRGTGHPERNFPASPYRSPAIGMLQKLYGGLSKTAGAAGTAFREENPEAMGSALGNLTDLAIDISPLNALPLGQAKEAIGNIISPSDMHKAVALGQSVGGMQGTEGFSYLPQENVNYLKWFNADEPAMGLGDFAQPSAPARRQPQPQPQAQAPEPAQPKPQSQPTFTGGLPASASEGLADKLSDNDK